MSSSKRRNKKGTLIVSVPSGVEATVIGSDLGVVSRFLPGQGDVKLRGGIYKVIARTADATQSRLVEVVPNETTTVRLESVSFASPAPLSSTRKTHEYHVAEAGIMSRGAPVSKGSGAQLFLFARYWTGVSGHENPIHNPSHPLKGVSLHRIDGSLLLDVEAAAHASLSARDPFAGLLVELDPGSYRLRLATQVFGVIEQCIVVCRDWQTQLFALVRDIDKSPVEEHLPYFGTAAILMAPQDQGFVADANDLNLTEIARVGLMRRRSLLDPHDRQLILNGKFENPMLGILGAHLLIRERPVPVDMLGQVIGNLRRLVGFHPDVEIIAAKYLGSSPQSPFDIPPMLASSWDLISELAADNESLVPPGSLNSKIATARWSGGIWLNWLFEELLANETAFEPAPVMVDAVGAPAPQAAVMGVSSAGVWTSPSIKLLQTQLSRLSERTASLTGFEEAVVRALKSANEGQFTSRYLTSEGQKTAPDSAFDAGSLAKALKLPTTSMNAVLTSLSKKLDDWS